MINIEKVNHYTSIESLDKILESKKNRFGRFDLTDDQTENQGVPEVLKNNYFISCWSSESREMIPQWSMYAQNGIRIELPLKWYIKHEIPVKDTTSILDFSKILDDSHPAVNIFFPVPFLEVFSNNNYAISPPINETNGFVLEVEYCEDFKEKKQKNWNYDSLTKSTYLQDLHSLIRYKDEYWEFQKEIRYYLTTICKDGIQDYLPEYLFVPINPEALSKIEITLYPNCTKDDELKVIEICKKHLRSYEPEIHIKRSQLDGKYLQKK